MNREEHRIPWIFFLGAGASVAARVPTTRKFVEKFREHLVNFSEGEMPSGFHPFFDALEKPDDDVEALLELLHQHREIEEKPLGKTIELKEGVNPKNAEDLLNRLESFIHQTCYVRRKNVDHLDPLVAFLEASEKPLDIFSVNYDTAIEVYCFTHGLEFNNGFQRTWAPESLKQDEEGIDINLYKLHGSATWWLTEEGRLVEIPLELHAAGARTYYGSQAESLIVYPYDPKKKVPISTLDLLPILRDKLENADVAVVVGYSFRDEEIREIFLDAGRKNDDLKLVLIGPSAYGTYKDKLSETKEGVPSPLSERVLCLPFLFERVFRHLRQEFLSPFISGSNMYRQNEKDEMMRGESKFDVQRWEDTVKRLGEAGQFERVLDIIKRTPLETWGFELMLEAAPNMYLMTVLCGADEASIVKKWVNWLFSEVLRAVKLDPQKRGEDGQWRRGISVWLPALGKFDRPSHLRKRMRTKAGDVRKLMDMARDKDIPPELKDLHGALLAVEKYLEKRWFTDKPINLARFADDGCSWNEADWSPLKLICGSDGGWFDMKFLRKLETVERKTFHKQISKYWKIPIPEDE